jgi:hypothetical protein
MSWGTIQIGRVTVAETHSLSEQRNASTQEITLAVTGRQYTTQYAGETDAAIERRQEDFLGLAERLMGITFSRKSSQNGYYIVKDVGAEQTKWNGEFQFFDWTMTLIKVGPDNAVDLESRLGTVVRLNNFTLTGERWHAPSIGHYAYFTGSSLGTPMTRTGVDGAITVYRSIPANVNPRWGAPVALYASGRVKVTTDGAERTGTGIRASALTWELSNGLVRVVPLASGGMLRVDAWGGAAWETKAWNLAKGGATTPLGTFDYMTVLRNDLNMVTIRLVKGAAPGRTLVDLTLRRGSRFVEVYVQTDTSTTLGAYLETTETATDQTATGYVLATANDADGNQFIVGSSKTVSLVADRGISKASVTTFDAYIGAVVGGTGAASGDGAVVLRDQYIAAVSETVTAVRR